MRDGAALVTAVFQPLENESTDSRNKIMWVMNNKMEKHKRTFKKTVNRDQRNFFSEKGFKHMFKHVKMIKKKCELRLLLLLKPFSSDFKLFQKGKRDKFKMNVNCT